MKNSLIFVLILAYITANSQTWNIPVSVTNPSSTFIGTTSNNLYSLRANNLDIITINPNGTVGIGVSNAVATLQVQSSSSPVLQVSEPNGARLQIGIATCVGCFSSLAQVNDVIIRNGGSGNMRILGMNASQHIIFSNTTAGGVESQNMILTKDGILGIGTTIPTNSSKARLQITGNTISGITGVIGDGNNAGIGFNTAWYNVSGTLTDRYLSSGKYAAQMLFVANSGVLEYRSPVAAATSNDQAITSYVSRFKVLQDGKFVIGDASVTAPGSYKLYVADGILTEKVKVAVKTTSDWSDYVFADDYKLMSLEETEQYIKKHKHLPGVPSAEEVVKSGIDLAKINAKLLEKIEELTLHVIELEKKYK